jgi:hypothetical protein
MELWERKSQWWKLQIFDGHFGLPRAAPPCKFSASMLPCVLFHPWFMYLFFTSWAGNLTCTSCRAYTLECGRPNLAKFVNCLAALYRPNDKLLAFIACRNVLDWSNDWHSPQLVDQWEWNRRRSVLPWIIFFLKTCFYKVYFKFSRILTSLFCSSLSDRLWFQFTFGFHSALHLTYSFHFRQTFCFVFLSLQSLL